MPPVAHRLLQFNPRWLAAEYDKLKTCQWRRHPSTTLHDEAWFSLALFSVNGDQSTITNKVGEFRPTQTFRETQAFKPVIDFFQCPLKRVRLLLLKSGREIREHRDDPFYGNQETANIHIPIFTNDDVQFVVGGSQFHMQPGECWYIDVRQPHSVVNRGSTDRIHLVLHCVTNQFMEKLLSFPNTCNR